MRTQVLFYRQIALGTVMASMLAPGLLQAAEADVRHVTLNGQNIDSARSQTLEEVDIEIDAAGNLLIKSDAYRVQAPPTPQTPAPASAPVAAPADVLPQPAVVGPPHAVHAVAPPAAAPPTDDGPSMKETADFIVGKLNGNRVQFVATSVTRSVLQGGMGITTVQTSEARMEQSYSYSGASVERCELKYTLVYTMGGSNRMQTTTTGMNPTSRTDVDKPDTSAPAVQTWKLSEFDPVDIKVETFDFNADLLQNPAAGYAMDRSLFVINLTPGNKLKVGPYFEDRETAKRVAKAIQRAATLCGGKTAPF